MDLKDVKTETWLWQDLSRQEKHKLALSAFEFIVSINVTGCFAFPTPPTITKYRVTSRVGKGSLIWKCNRLQMTSYPIVNVISNVTILITLSK